MYRWLLKMALEQLQFLEQIDRLDQELVTLSIRTRMRSNGWRRCRAWERIQRNRSLPKSARLQRRFLQRNEMSLVLGWCMSRRRRERRGELQPPGLRRATVTCNAFLTRQAMPELGPKEAPSRSFIATRSGAWDTTKSSGRLPIGSVG